MCNDGGHCNTQTHFPRTHNNAFQFQALRTALKRAKVTKTQALFHRRQQQNLVCLPYIGRRIKSTWALLVSRLTDWLSTIFDTGQAQSGSVYCIVGVSECVCVVACLTVCVHVCMCVCVIVQQLSCRILESELCVCRMMFILD